MGITGDGLTIAPAVGAVIVHPTTALLTRHGELGRAVSGSQLGVGDTLCSSTPWCRYENIIVSCSSPSREIKNIRTLNLWSTFLVYFTELKLIPLYR